MSEKIHHVVFHNDVDGIVSAAIFLHNVVKDDKYRLYPVMSVARGTKFDKLVKSMPLDSPDETLTILDFENHPRSDFWCDHHWNKLIGKDPVHNDKICYDPLASSAAQLLKDRYGMQDTPDDLIATNNIIDKALYEDLETIFEDTHPLMLIRAYLECYYPANMTYCRIAEVLANSNLDCVEANKRLGIDDSCILELREKAKKVSRYMEVYNNISVIRQLRPNQYPRYVEFRIRPDIKYSIRFTSISGDKLYLQIGYNKWHKEANNIHIGQLLHGFKYMIRGGGHYGAGGGIMNQRDAEKFLDDISIKLNPKLETKSVEEEMEKLGVDQQNDPVEKEAQDMVKSGEAENIDKAREKVVPDETAKPEEVSEVSENAGL